LFGFENHAIVTKQSSESSAFDCGEMDQDVLTGIGGNEAVASFAIKPFDGSNTRKNVCILSVHDS
jgi:hypothetical protein